MDAAGVPRLLHSTLSGINGAEHAAASWLESASARLSTGIALDGDYAKQSVSRSIESHPVGISFL